MAHNHASFWMFHSLLFTICSALSFFCLCCSSFYCIYVHLILAFRLSSFYFMEKISNKIFMFLFLSVVVVVVDLINVGFTEVVPTTYFYLSSDYILYHVLYHIKLYITIVSGFSSWSNGRKFLPIPSARIKPNGSSEALFDTSLGETYSVIYEEEMLREMWGWTHNYNIR